MDTTRKKATEYFNKEAETAKVMDDNTLKGLLVRGNKERQGAYALELFSRGKKDDVIAALGGGDEATKRLLDIVDSLRKIGKNEEANKIEVALDKDRRMYDLEGRMSGILDRKNKIKKDLEILDSLDREIAEMNEEINKKEKELKRNPNDTSLKSELDKLKKDRDKLTKERSSLSAKLSAQGKDPDKLKSELSQLEQEIKPLQEEYKAAVEDYNKRYGSFEQQKSINRSVFGKDPQSLTEVDKMRMYYQAQSIVKDSSGATLRAALSGMKSFDQVETLLASSVQSATGQEKLPMGMEELLKENMENGFKKESAESLVQAMVSQSGGQLTERDARILVKQFKRSVGGDLAGGGKSSK